MRRARILAIDDLMEILRIGDVGRGGLALLLLCDVASRCITLVLGGFKRGRTSAAGSPYPKF